MPFSSRSLSKVERNYSQIDKEALGTLWGVKKFHTYIFGRSFTLLTDHHLLTSIFHPNKGIPGVTAARVQHYALFLTEFYYKIQEYQPTWKCRCVVPVAHAERKKGRRVVDPVGLFYTTQFDPLPDTLEKVERETQRVPLVTLSVRFGDERMVLQTSR